MRTLVLGENETQLSAMRKLKGLYLEDLAEVLGVSVTHAGRMCSHRNHPKHRSPGRDVRARLKAWSGGKIDGDNFDEPYTPPPKKRRRGKPPASRAGRRA